MRLEAQQQNSKPGVDQPTVVIAQLARLCFPSQNQCLASPVKSVSVVKGTGKDLWLRFFNAAAVE